MDEFGDNFDQPEVDPAAEFLAREQEKLAGLEDEFNSVTTAAPVSDGIDKTIIYYNLISVCI